MEAFEFIRARMTDEEQRYPGGSASTIIGTAVCRVLSHEAALEDRRRRNQQPARSDEDLLTAALIYLDQNWQDEMDKARLLVESRSITLLDDRLKKSLEFAFKDAASEKSPIFFAIWTGVAANTVWILIGFLVLLIVLISTGQSLEDSVRNILA